MVTATTSAIRVPNWRTVVLFWTISHYLLLSLPNGSSKLTIPPSSLSLPSSDPIVTYSEQSKRLYDKMERDLQEKGPVFLKQGETSQSLSLSDLFTLKDGIISPVLKVADPPVRANVLHLSTEYSVPVSEVVKNVFGPYFENTIWYQDSNMYHFSMFHASHHIASVPATEDEVETEAAAVKAVANKLCPLEIILDRVLLTSTGVLLGCWKVVLFLFFPCDNNCFIACFIFHQVNSGDDPITIRSKLRSVLPRAPEKQLYDAAILHTSLARLLGPPISPTEASWFWRPSPGSPRTGLENKQRNRGFKALVSELWYVEEFDLLALALGGRMKWKNNQIQSQIKLERMGSELETSSRPVVSLVYPLHASVKAIEAQSHADDKQWLTYWVLYSLLTLFELTFAKLIEWVPIWSYAKLIVTCWLVIPYFSGAAYVYEHFVRPVFVNPQSINIWYVPKKMDIFRKPDDVLTAAEKYIADNGPDAFEKILSQSDKSRRYKHHETMYVEEYHYQENFKSL
ncbi:hypothetical protein Bca52824_084353 [Brassica carinata]|uniref:HVA22-like protein n=1 Tax=Brassica carinata TaxID=52824 RepID=A0A8X7PP84_BRACI|nr:hypothetical protein Bca52824_084353 [Brassica carinata]